MTIVKIQSRCAIVINMLIRVSLTLNFDNADFILMAAAGLARQSADLTLS